MSGGNGLWRSGNHFFVIHGIREIVNPVSRLSVSGTNLLEDPADAPIREMEALSVVFRGALSMSVYRRHDRPCPPGDLDPCGQSFLYKGLCWSVSLTAQASGSLSLGVRSF